MVGIDIIKVDRISKITNHLERLFSLKEIEYFNSQKNNLQAIAGHFAAKEAVMKCFLCCKTLTFLDIEIYHNECGKPYAKLYNNAKKEFEENNYKQINISISHETDYAVAICELI